MQSLAGGGTGSVRIADQRWNEVEAAAVRALEEVCRRLDRELVPAVVADPAKVVLQTSNADGGAPGPVVEIRFGPELSVELSCPPGDVWERAAAAVKEMHTELLTALLADPGLDLGAADALTAATRSAVLGPIAGTAVDHGPYRSVMEQVLATARSTPDGIAVHAGDGTLTYAQLVGHATYLSNRIRSAVPERGVLIPVLVAEGRALPVAWAAAMLAGVGYVPVDSRWPAQRVEHVIDLLAAPVVVCADLADVPAAHRDRAIVADLTQYDVPEGIQHAGADEVIYGMFTSGTTGTPLCAVNRHGGLANRLAFMDRWFGPAPDREVVLQNTRHTFDSAFWQVFWPLTTGGATVIPPVGEHLDVQHIIDLVEAHRVTVTDFVPAVLGALLPLLRQRPAMVDRLRSLRHVVVGGEQINPNDVHTLQELLPGLRVSNAYGPSEASIGMIFHEVTATDGDDVPLGRPIDNCVAVVVDADGRPLPPGATGEIVIGGACTGIGYHREPERTAQRFFESGQFGRMYRTGDLGHVDDQGRFHFGGRIDHQIKVGGVRVEPGEVEIAALGCPGVRQAVALVVGPLTSRELVLVTTGTAAPAAVLAQLRTRLPRGSRPQRIVVVDDLPLTDAGKIDRRRLAADIEQSAVLPQSDTDPVLDVLRSVLRRPELADADDFFAIGGNSLQAISAVVGLNDRFGLELGVRDLVEQPTAAALRGLITRRGRGDVPTVADLVAADLATDTAAHAVRARRPEPRTVFLTGATGFVGTRLLHELLEHTDLTVLCLVRGTDDAHARRRVLAALTQQELQYDGSRLRVVSGDLAMAEFGLSTARWLELVDEADLIVHAGAMVNLLYDYRMHREANVLGTAEIIRFARAAGGIPLHHVSTLGVLYDHAVRTGRELPEDIDLGEVTAPASGYSLSKWVAERLVTAADDLPGTVLRLGEIMPATDVAVPNPKALTHLLLTAFEQLDCAPEAVLRSDYSPVDTVARAVLVAIDDQANGAFHVYSGESVRFDELTVSPNRVSCLGFLAALRGSAAPELRMLLAIIEHRSGGQLDNEATVRAVLEDLLQDNPAWFARSRTLAQEKEPAGV